MWHDQDGIPCQIHQQWQCGDFLPAPVALWSWKSLVAGFTSKNCLKNNFLVGLQKKTNWRPRVEIKPGSGESAQANVIIGIAINGSALRLILSPSMQQSYVHCHLECPTCGFWWLRCSLRSAPGIFAYYTACLLNNFDVWCQQIDFVVKFKG